MVKSHRQGLRYNATSAVVRSTCINREFSGVTELVIELCRELVQVSILRM